MANLFGPVDKNVASRMIKDYTAKAVRSLVRSSFDPFTANNCAV